MIKFIKYKTDVEESLDRRGINLKKNLKQTTV